MTAAQTGAGPHAGIALQSGGAAAKAGRRGLVALHGRGGSAADMLGFAAGFAPTDVAVVAPQAAGHSWWPVSFLAPMAQLEPWLGSALAAVGRAVATLESSGIQRQDIALAGFSQGACLALEYALRTGGPWHSVTVLSGALVGTGEQPDAAPEPSLYGHRAKRLDYAARLDGVPVVLSCHAADPHIPLARVEESGRVLRAQGADLRLTVHPGAGHGTGPGDMAAIAALWQG